MNVDFDEKYEISPKRSSTEMNRVHEPQVSCSNHTYDFKNKCSVKVSSIFVMYLLFSIDMRVAV